MKVGCVDLVGGDEVQTSKEAMNVGRRRGGNLHIVGAGGGDGGKGDGGEGEVEEGGGVHFCLLVDQP